MRRLAARIRGLGDPRSAAMLARGLALVERGVADRTLPSMTRRRDYARWVIAGE